MNNVNVIKAKEETKMKIERPVRRLSVCERNSKKNVRKNNRLQILTNFESGIYSLIKDCIKRMDNSNNEVGSN